MPSLDFSFQSKFHVCLCSLLFGLIAFASGGGLQARPLQVYILAGQSNMQGHAQVRTFAHLGMDPKTAPLLEEMQNADGSPKVCERVWISSLGSAPELKSGPLTVGFGAESTQTKIGPEFTFGLTIQKHVDGPILLIKTAWGGKSINTDFRPPSAGPYPFLESQKQQFAKQNKDFAAIQAEKTAATGRYYRLMIEHIRSVLADPGKVCPAYQAEEGYELAGFVWFQGWNDMVDSSTYPDRGLPGGYDAYSEVMAHFIRDVRKDLQAPQMPFVIGVLGVGGPVEKYGPQQQRYRDVHQNFRKAMAQPAELPEFRGKVKAVWTENYWDLELTQLREKENQLKQQISQQVKTGNIAAREQQAELEKLKNSEMTEQERTILETGVSNAEFHYLGSAKILGQIGQAFAEAVIELK